MGFYATGSLPEVEDLPLKNRVGGFRGLPSARAWQSAPQPVEPHWETVDTSTKTVSGLASWLSRDPIGDEAFLAALSTSELFTTLNQRGHPRRYNPAFRERILKELRLKTQHVVYVFVDNDSVNRNDILGLTPTPVGTRYESTEAWWHVSLSIYGQRYGYGPEGTGWPAGFIGRTTLDMYLTSDPPRTEQPVYERFWGVFGDDGKTPCCNATKERRLQCANYYRTDWDFSFYWLGHSCGHYVAQILKGCCFILLPNATGENNVGK